MTSVAAKIRRRYLSHISERKSLKLISEEEETRTPTTQLSLPPQSSASTNSATSPLIISNKPRCPEQESNLHASRHSHLKRARLPFRHLGMEVGLPRHSHRANYSPKSGKRDSNSRPRPWQGRALPTELFPHSKFTSTSAPAP